jgi:hypothetical protein
MLGLRGMGTSSRGLAVLAGAVLALALAGLGTWWWLESREREAASAYLGAMKNLPVDGALAPEARAAAIQGLEAALARYPSAALAPLAAYELGNLRWAERDWARADARTGRHRLHVGGGAELGARGGRVPGRVERTRSSGLPVRGPPAGPRPSL